MKNTPSPPPVPTAAQAIEAIASWGELSEPRRKSLSTAVRTFCRLGGKKAPEITRLDPARCLAAMDAATPTALGVSPSTLGNARSGLRYILRRLGLLAPVRVREAVTDPRWATLIESLPKRFHPHRLRAFMEFCAARDIASDAISSETLVLYLENRVATRGGDSNRSDAHQVARQWRRMGQTLEGWPTTLLTLPPIEGRPSALPFSAYPASLQEGAGRYFDWCAGSPDGDPFDEGAGNALAPASIESRRKGLRLLLWGLVETGTPAAMISQLEALTQFDVARQTLAWHRKRLGAKPTAGLATMADTVQSLAAFFRIDGPERERLRRLLGACRPKRQKEIPEDKAVLIDRLSNDRTLGVLLILPGLLMAKARQMRDGSVSQKNVCSPPKPMEACWTAALAVAIQIELLLPIRLHDLASLKLDEEVRLTQVGRRAPQAHLRVAASKTGQTVETELTGEAAAVLQEYLLEFRPLGPHPETSWLFPNRDSADLPRSKAGFGAAIAGAIEKYVGETMTTHDFRILVATIIIQENPHAIEDIRAVLGHAGYEIAARHYRRNNRLGAAKRLSDNINRIKKRTALVAAAALPPSALNANWPGANRSRGRK